MFRAAVAWVERATVPGMMLHYLLRKALLEEYARQAIREGCAQVLVFGAGFDTLALRLSREHRNVAFVEVDHPAAQCLKREVLNTRKLQPENLRLLPIDLTGPQALSELAASEALSRDSETLFIAEGVLMYLDLPAVDRVFELCGRYGSRSRFAFTFMERLEDGHVAFRNQNRHVDAWLRRRGEPFRWGVPCGELPSYLSHRGFTARSIVATDELRERYLRAPALANRALADGDHVCLAERGLTPLR
jgi:methyltransferase (TIGR00027 family)